MDKYVKKLELLKIMMFLESPTADFTGQMDRYLYEMVKHIKYN